MTKKLALSKYFNNGSGHVMRFPNSDVLLFKHNGHPDGAARYIEHVKRYARNGVEHASLAALLRSVSNEHALTGGQPSFVCPQCGAESFNPNDMRERYCARCHVFVDDSASRTGYAQGDE